MMDFSTALDTKVNDIPKPKNLPQGTYTWAVVKQDIGEVKSPKGHWDTVNFTVRPVEAHADVDSGELEEYGALSGAVNRVSFMFSKESDKEQEALASIDRLRNFCESTLLIDGAEGMTLKEMIAGAVNCQFMAQAVWRQDGDITRVDVKSYMPVA